MSFTQPEFYWKETLSGILCELLLCHFIGFFFFFKEGDAFFFSGFQVSPLETYNFLKKKNKWTSFSFPKNFEGIVIENFTMHMLVFNHMNWSENHPQGIFPGDCCANTPLLSQKHHECFFSHQLHWIQCLRVSDYKLLNRSLSLD